MGVCVFFFFVGGKFYVSNNVENEYLQTSVYACLSFEAYQV